MDFRNYGEGLNLAMEWIARLFFLNLLWVMFTLLGLVLFGLFPATAAMFSVARLWLLGEDTFSPFKVFASFYRERLIQANVIGLVLLILAYILYFNYQFYQVENGLLYQVFSNAIILLALLYGILLLHIFPVMAHFRNRSYVLLKNALFLGLAFPLRTLMMIAGTAGVVILLLQIPALFLFFIGSGPAIVISWVAQQSLANIESYEPKQSKQKPDDASPAEEERDTDEDDAEESTDAKAKAGAVLPQASPVDQTDDDEDTNREPED